MVAGKLFTDDDRAAIARAVAEAERTTTGEIVPVVAAESDRYERAEDVFGIWFAITTFTLAWLTLQHVRPAAGEWESGWEIALDLKFVLPLFVLPWVLGALLAYRVPFFKRLAAGGRVMRRRVAEAAADAFERFHVRGTRASTGIVLYVSLLEHVVCVEADAAISGKVAPEEWAKICDEMVAAIRKGSYRDAFVTGVRRSGELLAKHFPAAAGDTNELTNELRIIEA